jgi:uncharacterized protein (TIGR01777 family)
MMQTVLISGGTGMIGTALTKHLVKLGYSVIILTRDPGKEKQGDRVRYAAWDPVAATIDDWAIREADFIVHLAGAGVADKRWVKKRKKEILDSRVQSGALLVKALKEIPNEVRVVVSSSATGYYGPDPVVPNPRPFNEKNEPASDFLASVVQEWEAAISPVADLGKRLVILRAGIVLSSTGGAYTEFKRPLGFGLSTTLGSGKQVLSWIHIDDLVRLYTVAIENEDWKGVYNAVAPNPVSNSVLMREIARQKSSFHIPVPVPSLALRIALGEMSEEVLKSTTVNGSKIREMGFEFLYPEIAKAIRHLE